MQSKFIIGGAQLGSNYGISNFSGVAGKEDTFRILDYAYDQGIDTIDTARSYKKSESIIGEYNSKKKSSAFKVITKILHLNNNLSDQVKNSLKKLSVKSVTLLTHTSKLFLDSNLQNEIKELKNKGYVTKIGVSVYTQNEIERILSSEYNPDIVQLPLNILDTRLYRSGTLYDLYSSGIEIHARSIFLQGLFFLPEAILKKKFPDVVSEINELKKISNDVGCTISELSLLWVNTLSEISKIIIGVNNVSQLQENINSLKKILPKNTYDSALDIEYDNKNILNPSSWI
ncbi:MAG: hypothetical protein CMG63_04530 [Candidatus Marinimicrobia bacterium]|nr:hypothetical protein [Candidatus Neomarinimicrobiota bacterium]